MDVSAFLARRDGVILAADLAHIGLDSRPLRQMHERGELVRITRGAYVPSQAWQVANRLERHLLRVRAVAGSLPHDSVFSHYSAAAVHGLPILGAWPSDVHVIGARHRGGHSETGLRRHGTINPPETVEVDGLVVTSVARTVVDLARTTSLRSAVITADCAQANVSHAITLARSATRDELMRELDAVPRRSGRMKAQAAIDFSTDRSESVGESLSRVVMWELGVPPPRLQKRFVDDQGEMFADFFWEDEDGVGEFDGKMKYFEPQYARMLSPNEILWKEKLRQDRLIAFTPRIVRWDWEVVLDPRRFLARLATIGVRPTR